MGGHKTGGRGKGGGAKLGEGCAPRPGPETATGPSCELATSSVVIIGGI